VEAVNPQQFEKQQHVAIKSTHDSKFANSR